MTPVLVKTQRGKQEAMFLPAREPLFPADSSGSQNTTDAVGGLDPPLALAVAVSSEA